MTTTLTRVLRGKVVAVTLGAAALLSAASARADFPYPTCAAAECADPADFGSYLFLAPGELPNDFLLTDGGTWKYLPDTGMNVTGAWQVTTGRPDVVAAILDSGIRWNERDLAKQVWLNLGELPLPSGCASRDCNGDGFVSVDDFADVADSNGNGFRDGQDLIAAYSDGIDGDGNGYVDDIAGWDFQDDDNDPFDIVDYGHGTGEAGDQVSEANDGGGLPGFAPSSRFLPLKVADSFVAIGSDFAQAVVYAVDRDVDLISEALGTLSASETDQAAIDYAYERGIPLIASAADEQSQHHNLPAALDHTIWVNSIVQQDGTIVTDEVNDLVNGCTNHGARAWVAISSDSCSSEATGRGAGLVALLIAHGKNLMHQGVLAPYPGSDRPFSAEEVRQLLRRSADDIDNSANLELTMFALVSALLSAPDLGIVYGSRYFPTFPGWDQYTGYGRPEATRLLDVTATTIPPEVDLAGDLRWFDTIDPVRGKKLAITGSAAAVRTPGKFKWRLDVGCGVDPREFKKLGQGKSKTAFEDRSLHTWKPAKTAKRCGFDPAGQIAGPDDHTVTLRLTVTDSLGNVGEDRRVVAIHTDPTLHGPPLRLGGSAESPAALADLDGDGALDVIQAAADGSIHALDGDTGAELPGFPAATNPLPVHFSPAWGSLVPVPRETIVAAVAAGDLDGDGSTEVVVASTEGRVYAFGPDGARRPGFPVATDPGLSDPANRDPLNDTDPGILAAPVLADLDPAPGDGGLEIVAAALDGHVYVWNHDGSPRPGFPVRVADRSKVAIDDATGRATPIAANVRERAAKLVGSPAVGDLDGDGSPEIVVGSNEEYGGEPELFVPETQLTETLLSLDDLGIGLGGFDLDIQSRVYALHADGNLHAGGPIRPGWPARVPLLSGQLLPTVGTGTPGSPALANLDGSGVGLTVAIFGTIGPVLLLTPDGESYLGADPDGAPFVLANDFPEGFPNVPASAGSFDAPFFGALGSGAFADLEGDGLPEYVAATGGIRKLLDVSAPASQEPSQHSLGAWNPVTADILPAYPRFMDDLQFLTSPAVADVDGDGDAEVIQGSGVYLLRAYGPDGATPAGWPKFTHGWIIASATPGDVDGDGLLEVVAATREGNLYIWDTPSPAVAGSVQWQGFGADSRNTKNWSAGLATPAAP